MNQTNRPKPFLVKARYKYKGLFDAVSMLLYTVFVYAWGLTAYPIGRDYAAMADPASLPFLVDRFFQWELELFGAHPSLYRAVNMVLMHACMISVHYLVRLVVGGPFWMGTLAAVLFMANPVHSEAMLNLMGPAELWPCLLALVSLWLYASHTLERPRSIKIIASWMVFALAVLPYRENVFLVLVFVLLEALIVKRETRSAVRPLPFVGLAAVSVFLNRHVLLIHPFDLGAMFGPLYLIFYPIGLLPETAQRFHEQPWTPWLAFAVIVLAVALIYHKARRPAILFGLFSMLAIRLFQGGHSIDLVHRGGGGELLFATVMFDLALAALFLRIMDHPKWRASIIALTTLFCVLFFGLQIAAARDWAYAGRTVKTFQQQVQARAKKGKTVGVLPDCQYYETAPLQLSESVRYDTPFSTATALVSLVRLHVDKDRQMSVLVREWSPAGGVVEVRHVEPLDVVPWPYELIRGGKQQNAHTEVELLDVGAGGFRLDIGPRGGPLPEIGAVVIPLTGEEADSESQTNSDGQHDRAEEQRSKQQGDFSQPGQDRVAESIGYGYEGRYGPESQRGLVIGPHPRADKQILADDAEPEGAQPCHAGRRTAAITALEGPGAGVIAVTRSQPPDEDAIDRRLPQLWARGKVTAPPS
jgi:hypothetical protein